jgi:Protein of unknown function (DUF3606)
MANTSSRPRRVAKATVIAPAPRSAPAYVVPGLGDEDYAVAYRYGVLVADRHGRKEFAEVEPVLAEQWITARGTSRLSWDEARPAVREGYAGVVRVRPVRVADRPAKARTGRGKTRAGTRAKAGSPRGHGKATRTASRSRTRGDNLAKRGPQDRSRINVSEPWEVDYWCERLGVTPAQLKRAVKSAGPSVKNVRRQLGK